LSDNFLLVADDDELVQVDAETMNEHRVSIINVTSLRPQVLAYDWLRREVYWTSAVNTSAIFNYSFDDRNMSVVYVDHRASMKQTITWAYSCMPGSPGVMRTPWLAAMRLTCEIPANPMGKC